MPIQERSSKAIRDALQEVAGQATGTDLGVDDVVRTRGVQTQPDTPAQLQLFTVPLPREAIGIGATWTRTTNDGSNTDVERYTLVEKQGDLLTIDFSMTSSADAPGSSMSGRWQVGLDDPLVRSATLDMVTVMPVPEREGKQREPTRFNQSIVLRTVEP